MRPFTDAGIRLSTRDIVIVLGATAATTIVTLVRRRIAVLSTYTSCSSFFVRSMRAVSRSDLRQGGLPCASIVRPVPLGSTDARCLDL